MSMRARLPAFVLSASLALAAYGTASAQAPGVDVSLTAEIDGAAPPTVGDPITLTLRVTHPPGYRVTFKRLPGTWGDFELRGQSPASTADNLDGTRTTSQLLDAVLFAPGDSTTPDVAITVRDSAGQVYDIAVPGATVTVVSVLEEGDEEPKDIKPQAAVDQPPLAELTRTVYERIWIIAGAALAVLLGVAAYLLIRGGAQGVTPVETRAPHQIALEELYRIEALDLPSQSRFKEHYTLVADCVRGYLERAFQTPALDRTTGELQTALESSAMDPDHADVTIQLLEDSDLVKFTKLPPEADDARASTVRARDLVTMTVPPEPVAAEGAGA